MNRFELDLNKYNHAELEELFDLPKLGYNMEHVLRNDELLRQNIMDDNSIAAQLKIDTLNFLENAKKNIISKLSPFPRAHESSVISTGSAEIIKHRDAEFLHSAPSEYFAGTINPLNKRVVRQNINIDTRFRDNYYSTQSSNFHLNLPLQLTKVVSMQLSALEFPNTMYPISKIFGNNFFKIKNDTDELVITIPDGRYDYLALQNFINTTLSNTTNFNYVQFIIDLTNNTSSAGGSGRMIVSTSTDDSIELDFLTDKDGYEDRQTPLPLKLGWMMGFREGHYLNNTTYIAEGLVDLNGPRYIYLVIDDFNNNVTDGFYAAFNSSILNKNILARISLQTGSFSIISRDNLNLVTTPRQYFGPVNIQKLQIQLLDEYGRVLDLNNMDYSFCLTFQTMYEL